MIAFFLGIVGFFLYFLYDLNSVKQWNSFMQKLFLIGSGCVLAGTIVEVIQDWQPMAPAGRIFFLAVTVFFGVLEVYTLFFALPFEETYVKDSEVRQAYTKGVYALSRHPGVLWFFGIYFGLWGLMGMSLRGAVFGIVMSWMNVAYIIFQDVWSFPLTFSNYSQYKKKTPFLIPTPGSVRDCFCCKSSSAENTVR